MSKSIPPTGDRTTFAGLENSYTRQEDMFFDALDPERFIISREQVCRIVSEATRGLSRERIADDMTSFGCPTSAAMIDAWASPSRTGHNLPFYLAAPFERSCRTTRLSDWHVSLHGGSACYGAEALRREIAQEMALLESKRADFTKTINGLRKKMGQL